MEKLVVNLPKSSPIRLDCKDCKAIRRLRPFSSATATGNTLRMMSAFLWLLSTKPTCQCTEYFSVPCMLLSSCFLCNLAFCIIYYHLQHLNRNGILLILVVEFLIIVFIFNTFLLVGYSRCVVLFFFEVPLHSCFFLFECHCIIFLESF